MDRNPNGLFQKLSFWIRAVCISPWMKRFDSLTVFIYNLNLLYNIKDMKMSLFYNMGPLSNDLVFLTDNEFTFW